MKKIILFGFLPCFSITVAQEIPFALKEVVVSSLYQNNPTQSVLVLNDSVISKNNSYLSDLLSYNSVIAFKQYGYGMTSSVSFRGTTAAQTAVIWNGININSQLNGVTDFNSINTYNFNTISIKAGGGSVAFGSGAIGGSVHLDNEISFDKKFKVVARSEYGSFSTLSNNIKISASNKKWSSQFSFFKNNSNNNYPYYKQYRQQGKPQKNTNGEYSSNIFDVNMGYKINTFSVFKFYSQNSFSDRNNSIIYENDAQTKTKYNFSRNLLEYIFEKNKLNITIKSAYLTEKYDYIEGLDSYLPNFATTKNFVIKGSSTYTFTKFLKSNIIIDYSNIDGSGTNISNNVRNTGSISLTTLYSPKQNWQNEIGIRTEYSTDYTSPILFSLGSAYKFGKIYQLKINISKNYKTPSFNDLYWNPGGNKNLKSEISHQYEIGNLFLIGRLRLSETAYYNSVKNLIQWAPITTEIWAPQNINNATSYGSETLLSYEYSFGKHDFKLNSVYSYTVSKDVATNQQLYYIPFHKLSGNIAYSFRNFFANYQVLYNSSSSAPSYTDVQENIPRYVVSNISTDYELNFLDSTKIGFKVLNIFGETYQIVKDFPMPGRNFRIYIILKF